MRGEVQHHACIRANGAPLYASNQTTSMAADMVTDNYGNQPHNNMAPSLGIRFSMVLNGVYPPQS